jgi:hypothetical protein
MHDQRKLSKNEIAVIKGSSTYFFSAFISIDIRAVDGVDSGCLTANRVVVLPGLHKVTVNYILTSYPVSVSAGVDLVFTVEGGHEYKVKKKDSNLVVVDTHSSVVVVSHPLNKLIAL